MKKIILLNLSLLFLFPVFGQSPINSKFSVKQLKDDLSFLERQIFEVHACPYTKLSKIRYERLFDHIEAQLTDSLPVTSYFNLIRPVIEYLADEHAQIELPNNLHNSAPKSSSEVENAPKITYTRYVNYGYINAISFDVKNAIAFDSLKRKIEQIFEQVENDHVKYLFIDVSRNQGGNSAIGDVLIDYFYANPYHGYQCNWKRSDEYLALMRSWGITNQEYASTQVGDIMHFDSQVITPGDNPHRYKGKVFIIIGKATFSSAMMFATLIKDNHIATLAGETPQNGHPNHFGEMYSVKLPNTKISVRFGVKEWIRPAGKMQNNVLTPDIVVDLDKFQSKKEILEKIFKNGNG
jgi:hypothetical protein